jgi:hypothetical protein
MAFLRRRNTDAFDPTEDRTAERVDVQASGFPSSYSPDALSLALRIQSHSPVRLRPRSTSARSSLPPPWCSLGKSFFLYKRGA